MTKASLTLIEQKMRQRVASALKYHAAASNSAAQMAIAAAMCGLELQALKKEIGHGGFTEWFEDTFAGSDLTLRSAQRYMALADGLKSKALKNDTVSFLPLLEAAPSALSQGQQAQLTKAVAKMTDGATLSELYQDFGIAKKPQGSGAKGGARRAAAAGSNLDPVEAVATLAREHTTWFLNLVAEELRDRKFNAADEKLRRELHQQLIDLTAAVKETL